MSQLATQVEKKQPFLQSVLLRPKQLWLRRALFQIHLWLGIALGLYVFCIGLSGSLLVFKEELTPKPHIATGTVNYRDCKALLVQKVLRKVQEGYPDWEPTLLSCPYESNSFFATSIRNKKQPETRTIYSDPHSGEIVGDADTEHSFMEWLERFHIYLLMGRRGLVWNGIGAGVLLVLVISGMALWWPGIRTWMRSLVIHPRASWKRINWDLHNVLGFWTVFFTLTWAVTGMYFAWPKTYTALIRVIAPISTASYPAEELKRLSEHAPRSATRFEIDSVLAEAQKQSPRGALAGVFYGSGNHAMFTVYMSRKRVGDYANTDFVYFDQRTGALLYTWRRGENHTLGDWLLWPAVPLHFGTSWGLGFKLLWFVLGLTLPALTVTGFLMYWNRYLRKHWFRKAA